jgi:putative oxidoreductase
MNAVWLIGRIILGGFFIIAGVHHFKDLGPMSAYAKTKGTPAPEAAVAGSGVLLLLGGLSMLLGVLPFVGAILLIVFLVSTLFQMHAFWKVSEPAARAAEQVNFMKNVALIGALLMILAVPGEWPLSLWIGR